MDHPLSSEDQLRQWREEISSVFDVRPLDHDFRETFFGRMQRYNLGSALLGEVETSAQRYRRSESLIGQVGVDHVLIQLYEQGTTTLELDGGEVVVRPNDVLVLDLSRPVHSVASDMRAINIVVPRALLNVSAAHLDKAHGTVLSGWDALGGLAGDHLRGLLRAAPDLPAQGSQRLVEASGAIFSACLSPSLARSQDAPEYLTATLARMRRFIDHRIADPALGPSALQRQFGVSRSALYRLFEPLGGVSDYIRRRRLDRANIALSASTAMRGGVGQLARRLGFPSEDAFSRAFKARFGLSPREAARARAEAQRRRSLGDDALESWLRHLSA